MNVLLLGSGGREHALAVALAGSPLLGRLLVAPGNPGTAAVAQNVALDLGDNAAVVALARRERIDLVVVGPEAPLVAGLVDDLDRAGIAAFGPSAAAARLEGSKSFTKELCHACGIPTAAYARFETRDAAAAYVDRHVLPVVIKADGLAAGKGVVVAATREAALAAVDDMFAGSFGTAGLAVVIEAFLEGEELSFFALCDGTRALAFGSAQDHKRVGEGDTGPNTGGMGAVSPAPGFTPALQDRIMREIIGPTLDGMAGRSMPFRGMLFAGLMIGPDGPQLIEYNVRLGDPEAQVLLPRLAEDLLPLLLASAQGRLAPTEVRLTDETALTVVMAAENYPGTPVRGTPIEGLAEAAACPGVQVFQAGTQLRDGTLVADGGRVLAITGLGANARMARERAYAAVDVLRWPGGFCRRDIGWRAIAWDNRKP